jgi:hypothetical protein
MAKTLYVVRIPHATFSLEVRDGIIVRAAPIAAWTVGRKVGDVLGYYVRRFPGSEWMAIPDSKEEAPNSSPPPQLIDDFTVAVLRLILGDIEREQQQGSTEDRKEEDNGNQ